MGVVVSSLDEVRQSLVLRHVERIQGSKEFQSSKRCRDFLKYVVTETLEGRSDELKERNIATAVFGRDNAYDPSEHSLVRVKAVEVRKRLAKYYESVEADCVRIELPPGAYVPTFLFAPIPEVSAPSVGRGRKTVLVIAGVALVSMLAAVGLRPAPDPLEQLWKPFTQAPLQVLIGIPAPKVYQYPGENPPPEGGTIPASEIRLMQDYTGRGAAIGAARVAALLAGEGRSFEVKFGSDLSFADLKRQPAVLLGGYSSAWTMELAKHLPVRPIQEAKADGFADTSQPSRRWMRAHVHHSAELKEDYALVARLLNSGSGQNVMLAAGLAASGTQAAVEFLTTRTDVERLLASLPPDWERKNFLAVLHAEIHVGNPGPPKIVHTQVW